MAGPNPNPLILTSDQFLLNRDGATFKTPFQNVADNVLELILKPEGNAENSLIFLNDLGDVNLRKYVKQRDAFTGAPTLIGDRGLDGVDIAEKFWILQHVNPSVAGDAGVNVKNEFVLADPKEAFAELAGEIGDALEKLELDNLLDVQTKLVEGGAALPFTIGDTFLLATGQQPLTNSALYAPRSLSKTITDIINEGPTGGIQIKVENLVDVNPIFIVDEDGNPGNPAGIRLEVRQEYKDAIPDAVKYNAIFEATNFDDILVSLTGSIVTDSVLTDEIDFTDLVDKEGNAITSLPAGWYYAENISDGQGKLEAAELPNDEEEAVGTNVALGGVRVLKYKNSVLVDNNATGDMEVTTVGDVPTNIGITEDGVLYSSIPQTLTYITSIDITPNQSQYFIYNGSSPDPNTDPPNIAVNAFGPLDATNGKPEDNLGVADSEKGPNTGDFYVIRMVDSDDSANDSIAQATVNWNTIDGTSEGATEGEGESLIVKNGDMVAYGGEYWSIIGSVNTDTVAQDLQNVTTRGNFTTKGIQLRALEGNGLVVGGAYDYEEAAWKTLVPGSATTQTHRLETNHINFDYIRDLTEAGQPLPGAPNGFPPTS